MRSGTLQRAGAADGAGAGHGGSQQAGAATAAAGREAAWQVAALLPRLARATSTIADSSAYLDLSGRLVACNLLHLLLEPTVQLGGVRSAAEAAQLLAAADAALGLLPLTHALWQEQVASGRRLPPHAAALGQSCLRLFLLSFHSLREGPYGSSSSSEEGGEGAGAGALPPGSPAEHEAAYAAARRLQLTCFRAVHWAAGSAAREWLDGLRAEEAGTGLLGLQQACHMVLQGTELVTSVEEGRRAGDAPAAAAFRWVLLGLSVKVSSPCFTLLDEMPSPARRLSALRRRYACAQQLASCTSPPCTSRLLTGDAVFCCHLCCPMLCPAN